MARITPTTLAGGYASIADLNANFVALAAEFEKCLYRDGEATNTWTADQDANSQRLLNLPAATTNQEPATLAQLNAGVVASYVTNAVNYITHNATITGTSPNFTAEGDDANLDLLLIPKGTGVVEFGTHTAIGIKTVTGYISIKDSGGTARLLAVVS